MKDQIFSPSTLVVAFTPITWPFKWTIHLVITLVPISWDMLTCRISYFAHDSLFIRLFAPIVMSYIGDEVIYILFFDISNFNFCFLNFLFYFIYSLLKISRFLLIWINHWNLYLRKTIKILSNIDNGVNLFILIKLI